MKKRKRIGYILAAVTLTALVAIAHKPGQGGTTNTALGVYVSLP